MLITTKHLLTFLSNRSPLHIESIHKLIGQRVVSVFGTEFGGRFIPVGLAITTKEEAADYEFVFRSIKEKIGFDFKPQKLVSVAFPAETTNTQAFYIFL